MKRRSGKIIPGPLAKTTFTEMIVPLRGMEREAAYSADWMGYRGYLGQAIVTQMMRGRGIFIKG